MNRRPPKYHHYWTGMCQMPPLKHKRLGESEVIQWMCEQFKIDAKLADAVFSSARHAQYVTCYKGRWQGDWKIGFFHWQNGGTETPKIEKVDEPDHESDPEEPVLSPEEERAQTLEAAKARFKYLKESYGM